MKEALNPKSKTQNPKSNPQNQGPKAEGLSFGFWTLDFEFC
jgi:hypothetical protein